jgi:hypothetical protein
LLLFLFVEIDYENLTGFYNHGKLIGHNVDNCERLNIDPANNINRKIYVQKNVNLVNNEGSSSNSKTNEGGDGQNVVLLQFPITGQCFYK